MSAADAALVFVMLWFLVFLVVLQVKFQTQGEDGKVVPGTPASAPARVNLKRRVKITTLIALVIWAAVAWGVTSGVDWGAITPDWMRPPSARTGGGTGG